MRGSSGPAVPLALLGKADVTERGVLRTTEGSELVGYVNVDLESGVDVEKLHQERAGGAPWCRRERGGAARARGAGRVDGPAAAARGRKTAAHVDCACRSCGREGAGAEIMRRVAAPMIGGLATSAFLTLEVLPVLYTLWRQHQLRRANRLAIPIETVVGAVPAWARQ